MVNFLKAPIWSIYGGIRSILVRFVFFVLLMDAFKASL